MDRRRKGPAVHAHEHLRAERRDGISVGLLDDLRQHAIGVHANDGELRDTLRVDVAEPHQRVAFEHRDAGAAERTQRSQGMHRIVVVRVEHEHVLAGGELFSGTHSVCGAEWPLLYGKVDPDAGERYLPAIVLANAVVLRPDDETDVRDAGVGQRADQVVEKRAADRDHAFDAGVGGGRLPGRQAGRRRSRAHARA